MTTPANNPAPDLKVYEVLVSALEAFPGNARRGDVEAIAQSLRINGQYRPIVVRKENREILAGNHTWQAAKKLGWEKIRVTFVEGLTDLQAKRIVLADNRYNDLATYSVPDLTELLESIPSLEGTGFDDYTLTNLEAAFSDAPKVAQDAVLGNGEPKLPKTVTCPSCSHAFEVK